SLSLTSLHPFSFFLILLPLPTSTLFPYTTLFRSLSFISGAITGTLLSAAFPDIFPVTAPLLATLLGACGMRAALAVNSAVVEERSEEHTSELQSRFDLVCRLLLEKKKKPSYRNKIYIETNHYDDNPLLMRSTSRTLSIDSKLHKPFFLVASQPLRSKRRYNRTIII